MHFCTILHHGMVRLITILLAVNSLTLFSQHPQIGDYKVFYGSLHNHCNISDGTGTAWEAYNTAKNVAQLDFFSLSDHAELMTQAEWNEIRNTADDFNENDVFTALWGFEWTSIIYGHLTITGSTDYCSSLSSGTSTFVGLNNWLNRYSCVAFLNHPGDYNTFNLEFNHFNLFPSSKIVGMELWNGTNGFNKYYYNDGYYAGDGGFGFYDEVLIRGWRIGASGACDMHGDTWGSGKFRMAVLADELTRDNLMEAFHARRFYSTLDQNLEMSFKIDNNEMGSVLNPGQYSAIIQLHDADDEVFTKAELVRNGSVIQTFNVSETVPFLSFDVDASLSDYYYVIASQEDGDQAVSSPIFFDPSQIVTGTVESIGNADRVSVRYAGKNRIYVRLPGYDEITRIVIADISGRNIFMSNIVVNELAEVSFTDINPGLYFLVFPDHPEWDSYKIVVE